MLGRTYFDWTEACRRTPSRSKVLRSSTCQRQENQETFYNSEATKRGRVLLELLVLLGLPVEAVVCLLQQTSKQNLQLFRPADKRIKRESGGGGLQQDLWETCTPHLSRQVLGSESSPRHMVSGASSPSEWSSSAQSATASLSPVREDGSLYPPCPVTSRLPANGERAAAGTGDFLTQIFPPFQHTKGLICVLSKSVFLSGHENKHVELEHGLFRI